MKTHTLLTVFSVLILSCCSPRIEKPKPFLKESKMVELLTEMQLVEAAIKNNPNQSWDSVSQYAKEIYEPVFKKYGLNKTSFEAILHYYTYHSWDLERIYTKVDAKLQKMNAENHE